MNNIDNIIYNLINNKKDLLYILLKNINLLHNINDNIFNIYNNNIKNEIIYNIWKIDFNKLNYYCYASYYSKDINILNNYNNKIKNIKLFKIFSLKNNKKRKNKLIKYIFYRMTLDNYKNNIKKLKLLINDLSKLSLHNNFFDDLKNIIYNSNYDILYIYVCNTLLINLLYNIINISFIPIYYIIKINNINNNIIENYYCRSINFNIYYLRIKINNIIKEIDIQYNEKNKNNLIIDIFNK